MRQLATCRVNLKASEVAIKSHSCPHLWLSLCQTTIGASRQCTPHILKSFICLMQDANKSLEQLEALRGTLQPEAGIHMHCTERGKREE